MRVSYTPELIAHIRHRYENTDDTLAKIAEVLRERACHQQTARPREMAAAQRPAGTRSAAGDASA